MKTRVIVRDGKRAGWIRPARGGYMVKVYGAEVPSSGIFAGSTTDCRWVKFLREARVMANNMMDQQ
jgi:hypothetical protein